MEGLAAKFLGDHSRGSGIFRGDHNDDQELMLGKHLLPHARWPLNVRIAAVCNDMGKVRRAIFREGCRRIYQLWMPGEDRQSGKMEMPSVGGR